MPYVINKQTGESIMMDTNEAISSGQYWVNKVLPSVPFKYVKDDGNGNPVEMSDAEKEVIDNHEFELNKQAKIIALGNSAEESIRKVASSFSVSESIFLAQLFLVTRGSSARIYPSSVDVQIQSVMEKSIQDYKDKIASISLSKTQSELDSIF